MRVAWVLSLLVHALMVSLSFGSQGLGLPGLDFPWRERRFEADELRVVLEPAPTLALAPATAPAWVEPSADHEPTPTARAEPEAANDARAGPAAMAVDAPATGGVRESVAAPPPPPTPALAVMAVEKSIVPTLAVPVAPVEPTPVIATASRATRPEVAVSAPRDADDATHKQIDQEKKEPREAKERAIEQAKIERAKQEEQRQAEQTEAARQLTARQEAERKAAEQTEVARLEAERLETARQAVASKEAARVAAERAEAARQAAVRQEAERMEAARLEGARQDAARQDAAAQEKARQVAARAEEDAKRDAVRRAMGRQLDEEAAKRDAAARAADPTSTLPYSWSNARRGRLFGRTDPNSELILYAEAWSRKIELNMTIDMVREAAKERHNHPLVTVALRSDGSVESVTFVVSSGVPVIDEAIRRIVQSQAPYPAFSPALAREFDVIEIRRSWHFDMAVRLF